MSLSGSRLSLFAPVLPELYSFFPAPPFSRDKLLRPTLPGRSSQIDISPAIRSLTLPSLASPVAPLRRHVMMLTDGENDSPLCPAHGGCNVQENSLPHHTRAVPRPRQTRDHHCR